MPYYLNCARCGAPFEAQRSDATYCSVRCRVARHRSRRRAELLFEAASFFGVDPSTRIDRVNAHARRRGVTNGGEE